MSIIDPTPVEERLMVLSDNKTKDVSEREKIIISGVDELFTKEDVGTITSLVPDENCYRIVSCKNYRREFYVKNGRPESYEGYWVWLGKELMDYQIYLDFLYRNNITDVSQGQIYLKEFEALIKALMTKYSLSTAENSNTAMMKVGTYNFNSFVIFNSDLIRSSFNRDLLADIKNKVEQIKTDSKNLPSLEILYKYFMANPRPQMKVKTYRND